MTTKVEKTDVGFTPLPLGWYNYYKADDEHYFRSSCPGLLHVESTLTGSRQGVEVREHIGFEYVAADFDGDNLVEAKGANYVGTFTDVTWQETHHPILD